MSKGHGRIETMGFEDESGVLASGGATPHRVVLVGRTELDAKLRLDPMLELVRTNSTLEAIGELSATSGVASGAAGNASAGNPTTLVLAPDADGRFDGVNGEQEVREFLRLVRELEPGTRVLVARRVGKSSLPAWAGLVDGSVASDASGEALRRQLRGGTNIGVEAGAAAIGVHLASPAVVTPPPLPGYAAASGTTASPPSLRLSPSSSGVGAGANGVGGARPMTPAASASVTPPPLPSTPPVPPMASPAPSLSAASEGIYAGIGASESERGEQRQVWADTGDESLVRLLMLGKDPVPTALDLIRSRLGLASGTSVSFKAEHDAPGVAVMWRGRVLGRLDVAGVGGDRVAPHASWLGAWVALRDQHHQLRQAAFTDPLTGAYNRRFFDFFLRSTMEEARAQRRSLTLMVFDIDDFKRFNDLHGHAAGDEILLHTMRLLKSVIRPSDKVCRVGGDEFAVIFYDPAGPRTANSRHPTDVQQIAQRFQKEILGQKFPKLGDQAPGPLTISAGLATYPWDGRTPEELLQTADELALKGKRQGKNVISFGPGLGNGDVAVGDSASGDTQGA